MLNVGGGEKHPFVMKVKINNQPFSTMISSDSLITKFTQTDTRAMLKVCVIFARSISKQERTVQYNNILRKLLEFTTVDAQVKRRQETSKNPDGHHERWRVITKWTWLAKSPQLQSTRNQKNYWVYKPILKSFWTTGHWTFETREYFKQRSTWNREYFEVLLLFLSLENGTDLCRSLLLYSINLVRKTNKR